MELVEIKELEVLQNITFEALKYITDFCDTHHLRYYLVGGTLLGAVRHKGWIPWDDDVDIMLPREDYDKLIAMTDQVTNDTWKLESFETNSQYLNSWAKLCHRNTLITPSRFITGFINGMSLDVFPIDAYDTADTVEHQISEYAKKFRKLNWMHTYINVSRRNSLSTKGKIINFFKYNIIAPVARIVWKSPNKILEELSKSSAANDWDSAEYVGLACLRSMRFVFPKSFLDEKCLLPFEDRSFWATTKYQEMLTIHYGDYMTPPPPEKQVPVHTYTAYYLPEGMTYDDYNRIKSGQ